MISRLSAILAVSATAMLVAACAASSSDNAASDESAVAESANLGTNVHVMRMHDSNGIQAMDSAGPSGANLKYFGGPVLANVKVYAVYWGANVQFQDHINAFYPAITQSAYFDWLSEYNTPTQQIGHGSFGGAVVDTTAPTGTKVTDAQIQTEIGKLIDAGKLPANDGNNLFMMYFPPGVKITGPQGAGTSCVQFCAYHGTFVKNGKNGYYGVMPDLGGACASGCGDNTSPQDNVTEVSSHEMIEAVTDGAVGLATTAGPPLAWYDNTNGEIGDICNGTHDVVAGYTVQLEWSNKIQKCTSIGGGSSSSSSSSSSSGATSSSSSSSSSSGATSSSSSSSSSSSTSSTSGGGGGTCSHNECSTGAKLTSKCDSCVTQICAADAYCCKTKWDAACVKQVATVCGNTCN